MKNTQAKSPSTPPSARPPAPWFQPGKIGPAFWTVASVLSLIINIVLIVIVIGLGSQLFAIKSLVSSQLVDGLYNNFVLMDQAHIRTSIPVKTQVPAKFTLPLNTETTVRLTEDTYIQGARVSLYGGVVTINSAPTDIILPAGSELPVKLELEVPVDQQIPVELVVDVDIPLQATELHQPFTGLQQVLTPYRGMLSALPDSWAEVVCGQSAGSLCRSIFH